MVSSTLKDTDHHKEVNETASPITPRFSYVLARLERVVKQCIDACVKPYGLTVPQYTALSILNHRSGLSNAQLARRTYVSPQAMNQILDCLDQAGFIKREPHATHGRILTTKLTAQGKTILAKCDAAVDKMEATMLQDFEAETRTALTHNLITCVRALKGGFVFTED